MRHKCRNKKRYKKRGEKKDRYEKHHSHEGFVCLCINEGGIRRLNPWADASRRNINYNFLY